ncbi:hypothetical protein CI109_104613 [Kwoniella shandongensis]|uniref:Uncharacterized protein n=1 Tax=Kwoniella shandongensis TaxID=1734106 RepID=A0A5M6C0P7_9TREE|nr:uncharacterized protein CI109_004779 [Kwoniella shandongensis]KAA5526779.1 hypothetical protein CI109_004779 [Kwoniella shandongensis]
MTSRLKHKLELDNVNVNSAYLNESFVQIGTPLPALNERKGDKLEYVPEWQQEVRDEQGRRRFHGAFTGGFSAGYYNSVGSKEGWAPSTFKSSRNQRANKVQRPEDFMDEEDLQMLKDDRKLENTETFRTDTFGGTKEELAGRNLPSAIESLIAPARNSIGQKLLQKLGWRPGQGIGPRVTLRKLRLQEGKLGKARVGIDDADEEMDDVEAGKHTFAPRDVKLLTYDNKEDKQGLGFEKGTGMGSLPGKAVFRAGHVVEDEDDDLYGGPSGSSSQHFAFNHGDEEDDDVIVMGGPSTSRPGLGSRRGPGRERPPFDGGAGGDERWHDGRPVLVGFALDPKGVPPDKWFAMPEIPPDWRPRPARVWGTTRRWDEQPGEKKEEKAVIRGAPGRPLTFEQRGAALGEEQRMISKAKSVYEYMSEKDKERLASLAASAQPTAPPPLLSLEPEPQEAPRPQATEIEIPPLSPRTASAALKGYVPYADDEAKQERYKSYLLSQTYNSKQPDPVLRPSSSIDDINKELADFASSARIFKPMAFAMASRFTTGSSALAASDLKQAKPGLHIYDAEKAKAELDKPKPTLEMEVKKDLTPREQAAANGMYGKMTREVKQFYPVKLLCKRFGVQDPHPEGDPGKAAESSGGGGGGSTLEAMPLPKNDASWEDKFIHLGGTDKPADKGATSTSSSSLVGVLPTSVERVPTTLAEVGMADDVNQGRDTLTYTKPNIDIFKAIFASDDEDDGDDDDEKEVDKEKEKTVSGAKALAGPGVVDPFPPKRNEEEDDKPVDLNTFKPVFTLRREDDKVAKKEKKKDKSKKRKGVLSFDVGEDGEDDAEEEKRREEKRKKRKEKERSEKKEEAKEAALPGEADGEGEGEWVEKPQVVPRLVGRKGAADFM